MQGTQVSLEHSRPTSKAVSMVLLTDTPPQLGHYINKDEPPVPTLDDCQGYDAYGPRHYLD